MTDTPTIPILGKDRIDQLTATLAHALPEVDCPVDHVFTPGLYSRTIYMDENLLLVSKTHLTDHQYILSEGVCSVWIDGEGWRLIQAPYRGVTKAGTRRILFIHMNCVWTCFHATPVMPEGDSPEDIQAAVDQIEAMIIQPNPELVALKQKEELWPGRILQ